MRKHRSGIVVFASLVCALVLAANLPKAQNVAPLDISVDRGEATLGEESGSVRAKAPSSEAPSQKGEGTTTTKDAVAQPKDAAGTQLTPQDSADGGMDSSLQDDGGALTDEVSQDDSGEENREVFVMPENAEYEPQTAVVEVTQNANLQELQDLLSDSLGGVSLERISDTYVRVQYGSSASVEDAVNAMLDSGFVEAAQPNYTYHVLEETSSLTEKLDAALTRQGSGSAVASSRKDKAKRTDKTFDKTKTTEDDEEEKQDAASSEQQGVAPDASEAVEAQDAADEVDATERADDDLNADDGATNVEESDQANASAGEVVDKKPDAAVELDEQPQTPGDATGQAEPTQAAAEQAAAEREARAREEEAASQLARDETQASEREAAQTREAAQGRAKEVQDAEDGRLGAQSEGQSESSATSGRTDEASSMTEASQGQGAQDEVGMESLAEKLNDPQSGSQWALSSIGAYEAWAYAKSNNKVTVATIDLGMQVNHRDLAANVVDPYNAYNAVHGGATNDVSPCDVSDDHGTHVAGIIAAISNNGVGISGVSYNANIMPVKVVNSKGLANTAEVVKAYDYILGRKDARNVRVINLSMGADIRKLTKTTMSFAADDAVLTKVKQAYDAGIVTVAAAGNRSSSLTGKTPYTCYPSDSEYVVSVMNLQQSGSGVTRADGSNYNASGERSKNIAAPGTAIVSTVSSNRYQSQTGTSMAAPMVSGALALAFSAKPSLSSYDAVRLLYATAKDLGGVEWSEGYGWGEVDAAALVKSVLGVSRAAKSGDDAVYQSGTQPEQKGPTVSYRAHVQRQGWQNWKSNGLLSGTSGESLRLEGVQIKTSNVPYAGSIQYRTHVQTSGWESAWKSNGATSGTVGQSKRLEAIQIRLTGEMAEHYDVWYRVHAQRFGWLGWARNGDLSGTAGYSYRLEALQVKLLPKGSSAPGSTSPAFKYGVHYSTHVQRYGWQSPAHDGGLSGTTGESLRLEGIKINVGGSPYSGSIRYCTHVQTYGWQDWQSDGQMSGTTGQSKRLEAIQIVLTGDMEKHFDIYYRVHAQRFGWMGWAKNGESAGSAGFSYRLEAIQIRLVEKGDIAPGSTVHAFRSQ